MRTFPEVRIRPILAEASRAQDLLDRRELEEARNLYAKTRARALQAGLDSGYLAWGLAVAHDQLGELEPAFTTIMEAVIRDPINPQYQHSFNLVASHLRAALADEERPADDPTTRRLYELLLRAGEADVACHLAMARQLAHEGKRDEAMRLVDAVTLLAPVSRDAWVQKAALARALGDAMMAAECEAQAAAIAPGDVPFALGGPNRAAADA